MRNLFFSLLKLNFYSGEESAEMLEPHKKELKMLGLGTSVGTPEDGITGEVIVVKSFDDLELKKDEVRWLTSFASKLVHMHGT